MLRFFYLKYLDQRRNSNERTSRARSQRKNGVSSQRKPEYEASGSAIWKDHCGFDRLVYRGK